ncbi:D,D-heptose 1,7-bisphosphate phosphatase [Campylobacter blaseri]|uniref:D,D-heptose 1,7-bisphosphate phosphatase n=1 Tax=Campylobacter blaseri TaxID=2042961 RepID=A0A2P8QZQ5_9BACT|nr:D-glycero-beta-D-manno-heptose 1,7-bisphosphate 7-phosphatase [Campylobacter blaseri]PSM51718.1 D-glycero-beta-D-manno-heptose-1,7-bisphosphate 7-phosphatase [Campylobacter blaseri]PSM53509.1 D-glycero-beta-D-manno-heptose-1,7-bisphosphate 7-phosphatase [Campylobacter blaseri]QKF86315.1 D,D-heptose 1,7-bisphosphate phosphatase [Campylobacter blaseri]
MKKALFLDRDGVINEDKGYVYKKEDFLFCDGVFEALKFYKQKDFLIFIITNQSGIGRGYYTKEDFLKLNEYMLNEFKKRSIFIDKVYFCPHSPEEKCECRKPKIGMILEAKKEFDVDLKNSILIGDKLSDIKAGIKAGIKNLFLIGKEKAKEYQNITSFYDSIKFYKN